MGGPVPDAPLALCSMIGSLVADDGSIAVDVHLLAAGVRAAAPQRVPRLLLELGLDARRLRREVGPDLVVLAALGQDNGSGNGTQDVNGTLPADPADGQGTAAVTESASALRVQ